MAQLLRAPVTPAVIATPRVILAAQRLRNAVTAAEKTRQNKYLLFILRYLTKSDDQPGSFVGGSLGRLRKNFATPRHAGLTMARLAAAIIKVNSSTT